MVLKWYSYWPTIPRLTIQQVRASLPVDLSAELVSGSPTADYGVWIDVAKKDTVQRLERALAAYGPQGIHRSLHVEVDRDSRSAFDYYSIEPRPLEWHKHVHFDMTRPVCLQTQGCHWNMRILHPIGVSRSVLAPMLFGLITMHREMAVYLVVSTELRRLFEAAQFKGLEYVPCVVLDKSGVRSATEDCFVARIVPQVTEAARLVLPDANWCREHLSVLAPYVFDAVIRLGDMDASDFAVVQSVRAGANCYYYDVPRWFVSRRVLDFLLAYKVPALRPVTMRLKEVFKPIVLGG